MARDPARVLVEFYKEAMQKLTESLDRNVWGVPSNPRHLVLLSETKNILRELNTATTAWAEQLVLAAYGKNVRFVNSFLRAKGYTIKELRASKSWAGVHQSAIDLLLNHPTTGITPRLVRVANQMGQSIEAFIAKNKLLLSQNRLIRENVAMNIFMGEGSRQARNDVLSVLLNQNPPKEFMGLRAWRGGPAAQSLVEAPYLKVITSQGPRRIHIFDHVQMTATTTENSIRTTARNNRIQEAGIKLVRITPNPPLTPCVCSLYAGRVFALDPDTASKTGFPYLGDTPNGGPPFHPYCTHSTMPFIPGMMTKQAVEDAAKNGDSGATKTVRGGFPQVLVGKDFSEAQKIFNRRGGIRWGVRQNPQIKSFSGSRSADQTVLDALKGRIKMKYRVNDSKGLAEEDLPSPGAETGLDIFGDLE